MLLNLFISFMLIGMVAFGGGYAMLPLFERIIVHENAYISIDVFIDMIGISQITPGPIAINSATFIGYTAGSFLGAAVSTAGVVFIPVILVMVVSKYFEAFKQSPSVKAIFSGLRPTIVALIFASVFSLAQKAIFEIKDGLFVLVLLVLLSKFKIHPILVILISAVIGLVFYR
jgi:chromate transporter